jgi:peptide-methionine (S)-S-oxide reductase
MNRSLTLLLARFCLGLFLCVTAWLATGSLAQRQKARSLTVQPDSAIQTVSAPARDPNQEPADSPASGQAGKGAPATKKEQKMELATFGGGCFWCVEAVLQRVDGVEKVVSGYSGGRTKMPTYEQVCSGRTGHIEVVQVTFDPAKVSYLKLLEIFMKTHDPTTLDRQGHDEGEQYRSIIFTHNEEQAKQARELKEKLDAAKVFDAPIVTFIQPAVEFWPAEEHHQNYYNRNPSNRYCQIVVRSKVEKLEKFFKEEMKKGKE